MKLRPPAATTTDSATTSCGETTASPWRCQQVDLRFPREGIDYDSLSEEEQAQWESLDWGDDEDGGGLPERVDASAINSWLFNDEAEGETNELL